MGRIFLYKDWWKVVPPMNRLYNKQPEHVLTLRSGEMMHVRDIFAYDVPIIYEIFGQDIYHIKNLTLPQEAIVFDVGAHIGSFSVAIHSRFPDARITAFEPHPDNFVFLQKNAPFAKCINIAVAGSEGEAHLGDHHASSSYALGDTGIMVKTVMLGVYIDVVPCVDLLKVDVEGAEKEIFESLTPAQLAKIDKVMMEIHSPHKKEWFVSLFEDSGFKVVLEDAILFAARKGTR